MTRDDLLTLLMSLPVVLIAITLHEASHGYAAWMLGDDTAKQAGRLSMNPIRHIDPVGTLLVPIGFVLFQLIFIGRFGAMFGWAKPVPIDYRKMRDPRRDVAIVAAAGPLTNLALAFLSAVALHLVLLLPDAAIPFGARFIGISITLNLGFMLINLIPIPPLDGGRILVGVLPLPAARALARLERGGIFVFLVVLYLLPQALHDLAGIDFDPVREMLDIGIPRGVDLMLRLAGIPVSP